MPRAPACRRPMTPAIGPDRVSYALAGWLLSRQDACLAYGSAVLVRKSTGTFSLAVGA